MEGAVKHTAFLNEERIFPQACADIAIATPEVP